MKINIKHGAKHAAKIVQESSPTILTALGVVGVAATGYFTYKAARQTEHVIVSENTERENTVSALMTTKEIVEKVWKLYIPAVTTGVMTVGCIIAANRIQVRRMAALAGAYAVISGDFDEYREKAQELLGVKKHAELEEQRLKKQMDKYPSPISALSPGKNEFCEYTSMRYFESTIEDIKHAVNQLNYMINTGDFPCLNDFYEALGLDPTDIGDAFGWGDGTLIDVAFTPVMKDEGRAVTAVRFRTAPRPKFWKSHD